MESRTNDFLEKTEKDFWEEVNSKDIWTERFESLESDSLDECPNCGYRTWDNDLCLVCGLSIEDAR